MPQVRTIFVTGFPDDVKERELNNLLRFLPGYEVSARCALRCNGRAACCRHPRAGRSDHCTGATPPSRCLPWVAHTPAPPNHQRRPAPPPSLVRSAQASQMHFRNGQAQGFALFTLGAQARASVSGHASRAFPGVLGARRCTARPGLELEQEDPLSARPDMLLACGWETVLARWERSRGGVPNESRTVLWPGREEGAALC